MPFGDFTPPPTAPPVLKRDCLSLFPNKGLPRRAQLPEKWAHAMNSVEPAGGGGGPDRPVGAARPGMGPGPEGASERARGESRGPSARGAHLLRVPGLTFCPSGNVPPSTARWARGGRSKASRKSSLINPESPPRFCGAGVWLCFGLVALGFYFTLSWPARPTALVLSRLSGRPSPRTQRDKPPRPRRWPAARGRPRSASISRALPSGAGRS